VHYRGGGDTIKDLLSGEVKMMFSSIAPVQDFVRDGRLVGLATTGRTAIRPSPICRPSPNPAIRASTCGCGSG
jgi:tripartite-type tricarboxylate transporter receptor subunit TctC